MVVDSGSCLPPDLLRQWDITVAPHEVTVDGRTFRDGVDLHPNQFYDLLKKRRGVPATAPPRPQQFLEAFIAAGFGEMRVPVMRDDFILVGPSNDPAGTSDAAPPLGP